MSEYKKKFTFYGKEEYHAQFKLRMEYHSMSQSEFFRACVEAVIEKEDPKLILLQQCYKMTLVVLEEEVKRLEWFVIKVI